MSYVGAYIVQYASTDGTPYHWSIFIEKDTTKHEGAIFDIKGTTENYAFSSKGKASLTRSKAYIGRVAVGSVLGTDKDIGAIEKLLKDPAKVPIVHNDPHWNCQSWVKEALKAMELKGLLVLNQPPDKLHHFLTGDELQTALDAQTRH